MTEEPTWFDNNHYTVLLLGQADRSEVERVNQINQEIYNKHDKQVRTSHIVFAILGIPFTVGLSLFWLIDPGCSSHYIPIY